MNEMSALLEAFGLEPDDLGWKDLGMCKRIEDPDLMFEGYESSQNKARAVDSMCLSCPVQPECLQYGLDNNETGVWGGVYLTRGKMDKKFNAHKTQDKWKELVGHLL